MIDFLSFPFSVWTLNKAKLKRNLIERPKQVVSLLVQKPPPSGGQEAHFDWQRGYSLSISAFKKTSMWKVSDLQAKRGRVVKNTGTGSRAELLFRPP